MKKKKKIWNRCKNDNKNQHNLCWNYEIIISYSYWSLWDLNCWEFKTDSSNLLDVRIKSILAFKIYKLISLEYFDMTNRSVLVIVASAWFKMLLSILVILLRKVFLSVRKLGQWRRNWHVFQTWQPQVQSEFNVS